MTPRLIKLFDSISPGTQIIFFAPLVEIEKFIPKSVHLPVRIFIDAKIKYFEVENNGKKIIFGEIEKFIDSQTMMAEPDLSDLPNYRCEVCGFNTTTGFEVYCSDMRCPTKLSMN